MKRRVMFAMLFAIQLITPMFGCAVAQGVHSVVPCQGRVIDAETGEPIEGAVVLGCWYTKMGDASHYLEAKETVTDENGRFSIPPLGPKSLSAIPRFEILESMLVVIFKARYQDIFGFWESLREDVILAKQIQWEGRKPVIALKKLSYEERLRRTAPHMSDVPKEKQPRLIKEFRREDNELGRP
jgi:hypothetical protein